MRFASTADRSFLSFPPGIFFPRPPHQKRTDDNAVRTIIERILGPIVSGAPALHIGAHIRPVGVSAERRALHIDLGGTEGDAPHVDLFRALARTGTRIAAGDAGSA